MLEYNVRVKGDRCWSDWTYSGCDHYEAAEQYASEYDEDNDGQIALGEQLIIEIRQYGTEEIKTVAIYADTVVKYNSRDLTAKERE